MADGRRLGDRTGPGWPLTRTMRSAILPINFDISPAQASPTRALP